VSEGLANAAKHAPGARVRIRAEVVGGELVLEVADTGPGGATLDRGSGLLGLRDRVGAVAGSFQLDSDPGAGTSLRARIPLSDVEVAGPTS
jgi:signal transduction histidine kinase